MTLKQAAAKIKTATNLRELHHALIEFETVYEEDIGGRDNTEGALNAHGIDLTSLPLFGGREPRSTGEVWSWDKDRILTGVGPFCDWEIRELGEEDRL